MRRPMIIIAVCLAAAIVGFFFLARHIRWQLAERPYIAAVKADLRVVAAAQATYRLTKPSYAGDVAQLPANRDSALSRFVHVRIVAASADGFLAEGRHDSWAGRCMIATGSYAGDSLQTGEPRCYSS